MSKEQELIKSHFEQSLKDNYTYSKSDGLLKWSPKNKGEYSLTVRVLNFRKGEDFDNFSIRFVSHAKTKFYDIPKKYRYEMLERQISTYEDSMLKANIKFKHPGKYRKFVMLSQKPKDEIYYTNTTELEHWLSELGPSIIAKLRGLNNQT